MNTFQEYLERELRNGAREFRIAVSVPTSDGAYSAQAAGPFIIHPLGMDGDTLDITVLGDSVQIHTKDNQPQPA